MTGTYENGIYREGDVRLSDLSGRRRLPIGRDGFATAVQESVVIDKSLLIADVLNSSAAVTLFCRPRRFGKSLNMTMLKSFFEIPPASDPNAEDAAYLFEGLSIWDADDGRYREHQGAYPVIYISFNPVKKQCWEDAWGALNQLIVWEYIRHGYLSDSAELNEQERAYFERVAGWEAADGDIESSLINLTRLLFKHHGRRPVVLIDEYDAPVMAARDNGYYDEMVSFLKGWLTAALKDGGQALAFACLTGVQRISKESIFSDLNNLVVNTSLNAKYDERYGFTEDEVRALGRELGLPEYLVMRQPFPGPGLAIRCLGAVSRDKLDILRDADFIFRDEIAKAHLEQTMNQYFAVLTNMRSVGVMGDGRTYDYTLALRSVTTTDFMTANWTRIPYDVLDRVSVRIVNEVKGINRIVYDITSKPPATIEWE